MNCSNNITPCGCGSNPCGCKTSSDDVVYQGPNLSCTGISNCDTVTEAIEAINGFICGPGMVENIINNILNNTNLYNQFTTIVNNTVDCQTVWNCQTTTTTSTTIAPYFKIILDDNSVGSLAGACALVFSVDLDIYVQNGIPVNGAFIYTDALQTIPFQGGEKYYKVQIIDLSFMAVQVSDTGEILSSLNC